MIRLRNDEHAKDKRNIKFVRSPSLPGGRASRSVCGGRGRWGGGRKQEAQRVQVSRFGRDETKHSKRAHLDVCDCVVLSPLLSFSLSSSLLMGFPCLSSIPHLQRETWPVPSTTCSHAMWAASAMSTSSAAFAYATSTLGHQHASTYRSVSLLFHGVRLLHTVEQLLQLLRDVRGAAVEVLSDAALLLCWQRVEARAEVAIHDTLDWEVGAAEEELVAP